ncbi:MAG: prephenate dehydratase [Planctomycetota bacterium]|jgi:chorismate mutase/prephenate dehydratase
MPLDDLRSEIDDIDREIVRLLNRRAKAVAEIGTRKAENGDANYDPTRERQVYERIAAANEGPLPESSLRAIWREVMSAGLALQQHTRVAYFGPAGTFTHQAARDRFGSSVDYVAEASIPDVFASVSTGRADYGVVPIENSTEGPVNITADTLAETSLKVVSEIYLPIHLALLGRGKLESVRRVYSHSQPLAQAKRFLATKLPAAEVREAPSTAKAVETAALERGAAAIASELAAEGRDIEVLARRIEDTPDNETRFFVVGAHTPGRTGLDKTSIIVSIKDEMGALHSMLGTFREKGVNLTWIQSRPTRRRAWDYMFFIDCEGHFEDERIADVIGSLESRSRHVQVLGSYPVAERVSSDG